MNQHLKTYHICLHGVSLDVGNMGVRALTYSLLKLIMEIPYPVKIQLLYGSKKPETRTVEIQGKTIEVEVVNYRLSPKSKWNEHLVWILLMSFLYRLVPASSVRSRICHSTPWINAIVHADLVGEINGGDSFSDIYGIPRFIIRMVPSSIAILLNKRPVLLPQTYGPYQSALSRRVTSYIINHAERVYARDLNSLKIAQSIIHPNGKTVRAEFCPDVAFALESKIPDPVLISPPLPQDETPILGLNISGLLYRGGYSGKNMFNLRANYPKMIQTLIQSLLEQTDAHLLFIPHVFAEGLESDQEAIQEVTQQIEEKHQARVHQVKGDYDQNEIKGIISFCDFFAGSRMHSCIAALSQQIPCVGLAYSPKFRGVFESAQVTDAVIELQHSSSELVIEQFFKVYEQRNRLKEKLSVSIPQIQNQLKSLFVVSQ